MIRKHLPKALFLSAIIVTSVVFVGSIPPAYGQNPPDNCPTGNCDADNPAPITGIEWLLVAGGILGARKVHKNFRSRT